MFAAEASCSRKEKQARSLRNTRGCGAAETRSTTLRIPYLKTGHKYGIEDRTPSFRAGIESWKSALPAATLHVRFLIPELLTGGNPAQDFFNLLGLSKGKYEIENEARNPSLDVSVLHVLSKNPHLFSDIHDNSLTRALTCALPKKFRLTNVQMLSAEQEARIEEFFRTENLWLLNTFCSNSQS